MKSATFTSGRFLSLSLVLMSTVLLAQSNPVPFIYEPLSPASVNPGHAGFTLRVHGTGFRSGAVVKWNGQSLKTTFLSNSALRANVPAAAVAKPGTASVVVANPGTIASNVIYLPVRKPSTTVTVATDPAVIETGEAVVGDFNNDGKADISVAYLDPNNNLFPDVFMGAGNGHFTKVPGVASYAVMLERGNIAADFNNDGNLDLASCTSSGGADEICNIFLGDGKGGLTRTNSVYAGPAVAADVNGDGNLDAVAVSFDGSVSQLLTYLGNGDGTFNSGFAITLNSYISGIPVIGDFNGDGRLDVAIPGGNYDFIAVLLGNGDGTFQSEVDYPISQDGRASAVADVNGDGKLDILTSCFNGTVAVLLGKGDGTFVNGTSAALTFGGQLQIVDLNGDGRLDLATLSADSAGNQTLNIALGNGDGTFQSPLALPASQDPFPSGLLSIADFNNDGRLDFAISGSLNNFLTSSTTVLLQTPAK